MASKRAYCAPDQKEKRARVLQKFKDSYTKTPGIQRSTLGDDHAFCVYCLSDINISHSGQFDIETHCKSMKHKNYVSSKKDAEKCPKLPAFFTSTPKTTKSEPEVLDVTRAEIMLTETLVKLNVPLSAADTLKKVVKVAFPNSAIAKNYSCARNKTTEIVNHLATSEKMALKETIANGPFCLSTDGSNDQREKQYPVVLTFIGESGVETRLFSVPTLTDASTGENIFQLVAGELGLPTGEVGGRDQPLVAAEEDAAVNVGVDAQSVLWSNCLALGCDNANVMTGQHKGVYGFMKKQHGDLHLAGCPCHLLHRAAEKACAELPFNVDEVLVDVYFYLDKSSKRQASLEKFQADVKHQKILKHVSTRWLSVRKCIGRMLENWDPLKSFIQEEVKTSGSKTSSSAAARLRRLQDFFSSRTNKLYCIFLFEALEPLDVLNQQLQNESPQIHLLQRLLLRFFRQCLTKFVKPSAMIGKSALDIRYEESFQLKADKELFIGEEARTFIQNHQLRENKLTEFHQKVKKFWTSACCYMKMKFPLSCDVLRHAKVADIKIRALDGAEGAQTSDLDFFLDKFPCLLPPGVEKGTVKQEFSDYCGDNLTQIPGLQTEEERVDVQWVKIGEIKDAVGVHCFKNLAKVMLGILSIPHSNAACERIFSCVRKNKTDQRDSMGQRTLESLMIVKSRQGEPWERHYSDSELRALKSAYTQSKGKKN